MAPTLGLAPPPRATRQMGRADSGRRAIDSIVPSRDRDRTLGMGAILLWATLASLTVLTGPIPPFQTTAIVFTIGGAVIGACRRAARAEPLCIRPTPASLALGIYGLFGYHALYFAALKLAPPAEAHLICLAVGAVDRAVLRPAARAPAARAPRAGAPSRLGRGRDPGVAKARRRQRLPTPSRLRLRAGARLRAGVVELFGGLAPARRRAQREPRRVLPGDRRARLRCAASCSRPGRAPAGPDGLAALAASALGPVGAAFLLWDIGMKRGNVPLLGVLSYASPIISTGLLVALGSPSRPGRWPSPAR